MFNHEGTARTDAHNRIVAGYLAFVAGFVNSASAMTLGVFTSHVTGNIGHLANHLAHGERSSAALALTFVAAFFGGALLASVALESHVIAPRRHLYGALLFAEAGLLVAPLLALGPVGEGARWLREAEASFLFTAMGLQNSLVTRLSGAVVRTTHLTGVITDLGIEAARWFRSFRRRMGERFAVRLTVGTAAETTFHPAKTSLLLTILGMFVCGGVLGGIATVRFGRWAFLGPLSLLVVGGAFAVASGTGLGAARERRSSRE